MKIILNKKTKIIIAIIVAVAILVAIVVFVNRRFAKTAEQAKVPSQEEVKEVIDEKVQEEEITRLINRNVDFFFVSRVGNSLFYRDQDDSKFYKYDLSSKKEIPISGPLPFVKNVTWSPDGSRAIFYVYQDNYFFEQYKDPFFDPNIEDNKHYYWVYDFDSGKLKRIGENIYNATWSPDSKNIIYTYEDPTSEASKGVYVGDASFDGWKKISDLFFYEADIAFFSEKEFLISSVLNEAGGTELYKINYESGNAERVLQNTLISGFTFISNDLVFLSLWDPDSERVSFKKLILKGMLLRDLDEEDMLEIGIVSESGEYALSKTLKSDGKEYEFYKKSLQTGKKEKLKISIPYDPQHSLDMQLKGDTLYFVLAGGVYEQKL